VKNRKQEFITHTYVIVINAIPKCSYPATLTIIYVIMIHRSCCLQHNQVLSL